MTRFLWMQLLITFLLIIPDEAFGFIISPELPIQGKQLSFQSAAKLLLPSEPELLLKSEEFKQKPPLLKFVYLQFPNNYQRQRSSVKNEAPGILKSNIKSSQNSVLSTSKNRQNPATQRRPLKSLSKHPKKPIHPDTEDQHSRSKYSKKDNKIQRILKSTGKSKNFPTQNKRASKIRNDLIAKLMPKSFEKNALRTSTSCKNGNVRRDGQNTSTVCVTYPASWGPGANYTVSGYPYPYYYYPVYYYPYYFWG